MLVYYCVLLLMAMSSLSKDAMLCSMVSTIIPPAHYSFLIIVWRCKQHNFACYISIVCKWMQKQLVKSVKLKNIASHASIVLDCNIRWRNSQWLLILYWCVYYPPSSNRQTEFKLLKVFTFNVARTKKHKFSWSDSTRSGGVQSSIDGKAD